ncbi:MAG: ACP S-malonyltransferase [Actinobacteria bacterium]|nr:ACP S-malonyltransferase [Actinomycetota bacterium]
MADKVAYIFPGQGAQHVGMARDVHQAYQCARDVFDQAAELTGIDLAQVCFDGPEERLNATDISQVAILTTSMAMLQVGREQGFLDPGTISATGGLSLGEYTALCVAGVMDFAEAVKLVQKRGQYMQETADANPGTMLVLRGTDEQTVEQLCRQACDGEVLWPANYNCPGQIVASGTKPACARLAELAQQQQIPTIELRVAGAFHSELMTQASRRLAQALAEVKLSEPRIPVACNVTGRYYRDSQEVRENLAKQVNNPVRWQKCMEQMIADGIEEYYEIGPGKVLAGLARRISRAIKVKSVNSQASFDKA